MIVLQNMGIASLEYTPYFTLGFLALALGFYLIWKVFIAPRKRYPIIPTLPVTGNSISDTTSILLSDGSSLFTDGNIVIKSEKIGLNG
jgi:hypothetical protein